MGQVARTSLGAGLPSADGVSEITLVTGLEPLLVPVISKAASSGAAKAAGLGAREVLQAQRRRKIRALTSGKAGVARQVALDELSAPQREALLTFCAAPDLEHVATSLTRAYLGEAHGRKAEELLKSIQTELEEALRLAVPDVSPAVLEAMWASLAEAVLHQVKRLVGQADLAPALQAQMIKTTASLAAASVRNTELLCRVQDLGAFHAFETAYRQQVAALHATMRLPHAGTTRQVPYAQLFVQPRVTLDVAATPEMHREPPAFSLEDLYRHTTRLVILGDPGGGKSTMSRKLTFDNAAGVLDDSRTPFFVELRDYASVVRGRNRSTLVEYLESLCRSPYNIEPVPDAIEYLLLNDRALVILDGLDELLDTSLRRDVVEAVEGFAHRYPTCPMLVTSRRVGYDEAPLDSDLFAKVQLSEFAPRQVESYVTKWFALDESIDDNRQDQLAQSFMTDSNFVADLRVNPLMLSLMCGIYASENYIPRNRPDVYEKCAVLLFESWDKQRDIQVPLPFDAHVQGALRSLALYMYTLEAEARVDDTTGREEGIHRTQLVSYMTQYLREKRFDDDESAENAAVEFIEFCKGRAWVLTEIGAERYGFTHRTFLEYFTASQLVRQNTSAKALYERLKPHVRSGAWDVVAQLALQIVGRSVEDGSDDFLQLLLEDVSGDSREDLYALSFAARSLEFVVPRPSVVKLLAVAVVQRATYSAHPRGQGEDRLRSLLLPEFLGCSTENAPRVGSALREALKGLQDENALDPRILLVALLPTRQFGFMSHANYAFWAKWAGDNLHDFADLIGLQRGRIPWVGVMEFERGRITLRQLITWHGVNALYSFDGMAAEALPPFIYRRIVMTHRGGYFGLVSQVSKKRRQAIDTQLLNELPQTQTPWNLSTRDAGLELAWLLDRRSGLDWMKYDNVAIMLLLPMLEVQGERSEGGPGLHPVPQLLLDVREERLGFEAAHDLLEASFGSDPEARTLLEGWLRREFSLVSTTKRRRPASPRGAATTARS
jgi:hypothetical protein